MIKETNDHDHYTGFYTKEKQLQVLTEFQEQVQLGKQHLLVIGCSTSEVAGKTNWYIRYI